MRFLSIFSGMIPTMLSKDFGQMPYYLAKCHGWDCRIAVTLNDAREPVVPEEYAERVALKALPSQKSRTNASLLLAKEVVKSAKSTDALLVYHLTKQSIFFAHVYKAMNPRGVCVLKLDMDRRGLAAFTRDAPLKARALIQLLRTAPFDFATTETPEMQESLQEAPLSLLRERLHLLPIGFSHEEGPSFEDLSNKKQPIVLTVGRLGLAQKNNEMLLRAFCNVAPEDIGDWRIVLAGSRTRTLDAELARIALSHPLHRSRIDVIDFIASREELYDLYTRATAYCLTSGWESYALVLNEAAYFGCYLISTPVGAAPMLTAQGTDGELIPIGDEGVLTSTLVRLFRSEIPTRALSERSTQRVREQFSWETISGNFADLVNSARRQNKAAQRER